MTTIVFFNGFKGRPTVGEYFDPAYDCSDVVDRLPDAAHGFYWMMNGAVKHAIVKVSIHNKETLHSGTFDFSVGK